MLAFSNTAFVMGFRFDAGLGVDGSEEDVAPFDSLPLARGNGLKLLFMLEGTKR